LYAPKKLTSKFKFLECFESDNFSSLYSFSGILREFLHLKMVDSSPERERKSKSKVFYYNFPTPPEYRARAKTPKTTIFAIFRAHLRNYFYRFINCIVLGFWLQKILQRFEINRGPYNFDLLDVSGASPTHTPPSPPLF
jgi:hypothetical protein